MNKMFIMFIAGIVIIVSGIFIFSSGQDENQSNNNSNTTAMVNRKAAMMMADYTLAEVATHNSASDCWMVINNQVFDVTEFITSHPGGNEILAGCGIDATTLFETRPTGSGTPHSEAARDIRGNYYIGELK